MGVKKEIIDKVANDKHYLNYCKRLCRGRDVYNDLYQYVMLYLLEMDEDKLINISKGNLKGYIERIIWVNAYYKTTPFHKKHALISCDNEFRADDLVDDSESNSEEIHNRLIGAIDQTIKEEEERDNGHSWDVELFKIWMKEGSASATARATSIPYHTVRININQIIEKINENLNSND